MKRLFRTYEKSGMARNDLEELAVSDPEGDYDSLLEKLPRDEFPKSLDCGEKRDEIIRAMQQRLAENEGKNAVSETAEKNPAWYQRPSAVYRAACACALALAVMGVSMYTLRGHASPGRHGMEIWQTGNGVIIGVASTKYANRIQVGEIPDGYVCVSEEAYHKVFQKGEERFELYWGDAAEDRFPVPADERRNVTLPDGSGSSAVCAVSGETCYMSYVKNGDCHLLLISSNLTEEEMISVLVSVSVME